MANVVTLVDVKRHLRFPAPDAPSSEDMTLQWFLDAADEVVEYECDDILPHTYTDTFDGGNPALFLYHAPIATVTTVEESWGTIVYTLNPVNINTPASNYTMFDYSIENPLFGEIRRRTAGFINVPFHAGVGNILVTYTTGTGTIPGTVKLAELELIAHWYQNSQLRAMTVAGANLEYDAVQGALYSRDTESGIQNVNIGVPYRILEMLKAHRRRPFMA